MGGLLELAWRLIRDRLAATRADQCPARCATAEALFGTRVRCQLAARHDGHPHRMRHANGRAIWTSRPGDVDRIYTLEVW